MEVAFPELIKPLIDHEFIGIPEPFLRLFCKRASLHFSSMTYDQRVNGVWMICQNIVLNRFYMRLITGDPCKKASKPAMFVWIDHYLGEVADVDV